MPAAATNPLLDLLSPLSTTEAYAIQGKVRRDMRRGIISEEHAKAAIDRLAPEVGAMVQALLDEQAPPKPKGGRPAKPETRISMHRVKNLTLEAEGSANHRGVLLAIHAVLIDILEAVQK